MDNAIYSKQGFIFFLDSIRSKVNEFGIRYRALSMRELWPSSLFMFVCSYSEMRANLYCWRVFDAHDESFAIAAAIYSLTLSIAFRERQGERNVIEIV